MLCKEAFEFADAGKTLNLKRGFLDNNIGAAEKPDRHADC
jgi:hypothetical protein